jgi:hypothetical protein
MESRSSVAIQASFNEAAIKLGGLRSEAAHITLKRLSAQAVGLLKR